MKNKVLFLDRDGVINIDHGYVHRIEDFHFVDGIFDLCRRARTANYQIIIVTNQSGIARGLFDSNDLEKLHQWMTGVFRKEGVDILDIFYCPHHPEHSVSESERNCSCRKPKPGMLDAARTMHGIDMRCSIMIGDKLSDRQAALAAGVGRFFLFTAANLNAIEGNVPDDERVAQLCNVDI